MKFLVQRLNHLSIRSVLLLIFLVLLVKLVFLVSCVKHFQLWEDHYIALNILTEGKSYIYSDGVKCYSYQFPVYPFSLFLLYSLWGVSSLVVGIFHLILSSFTAWFIYKIALYFMAYFKLPASLLKNKKAIAFLTLLGFLLHPAITYYAMYQVHPFTLDMFMLFFSLYTLTLFFEDKKYIGLYTLVIGISVLTRGTLVVSTIPLIIVLWQREGFIKMSKQVFVIGLFAFMTNIPWLVRNYNIEGIIGYQSVAAKNLWVGSLTEGEGSNYLENGANYYTQLSQDDLATLRQLDAKGQYDFYINRWKKNIANDPIAFVKLFFVKLSNFWFFRKNLGNEYSSTLQKWIPVYKAFYLIILFLSCFSFFFVRRRAFVLFSMLVMLSLIQAFFYVETRHRLIIEPILIFFALLGIVLLIQQIQFKQKADPV